MHVSVLKFRALTCYVLSQVRYIHDISQFWYDKVSTWALQKGIWLWVKMFACIFASQTNCKRFLNYVTEATIGKVFLCTFLREHGVSENTNMCWFVRLCAHQSVRQLFNPRCEAYYWTNNWDFIQFRCSICSASTPAWHLKCEISQPREIENYNIFFPRLSLGSYRANEH